MATSETVTYFAYSEGIAPDLLRIGTLVLDYANPRLRRPYFHREAKELLEPPPLATADQRPFCSMMEKAGHDLSGSFGLEGLLEFGGCNMSGRSRLVIGENGSKVELIDPYTFFEENVLKADPARLWLETRLSVANKLKRMLKNIIAAPKIWLLTGVYYMENAQVYTIRTKSSSADAKITVPIPEPSGIAAMLGANAGAKFSLGNQWEIEAGAQISGKRVWAAQWTRVGARFFLAEDASTELSPKQLRLLDVWSVGTERGDDEPWTTELSLLEKGSDEGAEAGQEYDEKTWKEFEEDVERLLDDLAETD